MRFRAYLFDLDGTLIDHFAAIHRTHVHTMTQLGLTPPTLAQVRAAVGGGLEMAIERLAGAAHVAAAVPIYRAYWETTMLDDVTLLPGAREILTALRARGAKTAVFTNKLGTSSRAVCAHLGIAELFDINVGSKDTAWLKPEPAFSTYMIQLVGATAAETLLVGDSPFDVQAALNGGITPWCVTTGTHNAEELQAAGAARVFPGLPEVHRALVTEG